MRIVVLIIVSFLLTGSAGWATNASAEEFEHASIGIPDTRLEGVWLLQRVNDVPAPGKETWPGQFKLAFTAGQVRGRNGCNGIFGPYRVTGDRLEVALGQTTMSCRPSPWDKVALDALKAGRFEVDPGGQTLRFSEPAGRVFVFRRAPPE